jgi:hypothetical protein
LQSSANNRDIPFGMALTGKATALPAICDGSMQRQELVTKIPLG